MSNYQLLPPLSADEYDALKADIAARGVQVPIEFDDAGAPLDGHHRLRVCDELGITDYPRVVRAGLTEDAKVTHVLALNLARRHLSVEARDALIRRLRADGWSLPRIARAVGVGFGTAQRASQAIQLDNVTGTDGKTYPAQHPAAPQSAVTGDNEAGTTARLQELEARIEIGLRRLRAGQIMLHVARQLGVHTVLGYRTVLGYVADRIVPEGAPHWFTQALVEQSEHQAEGEAEERFAQQLAAALRGGALEPGAIERWAAEFCDATVEKAPQS